MTIITCDKGHLYNPNTTGGSCTICRYDVKKNFFFVGSKVYQEVQMSDGNWKICRENFCWEWPAEVELINQ